MIQNFMLEHNSIIHFIKTNTLASTAGKQQGVY